MMNLRHSQWTLYSGIVNCQTLRLTASPCSCNLESRWLPQVTQLAMRGFNLSPGHHTTLKQSRRQNGPQLRLEVCLRPTNRHGCPCHGAPGTASQSWFPPVFLSLPGLPLHTQACFPALQTPWGHEPGHLKEDVRSIWLYQWVQEEFSRDVELVMKVESRQEALVASVVISSSAFREGE